MKDSISNIVWSFPTENLSEHSSQRQFHLSKTFVNRQHLQLIVHVLLEQKPSKMCQLNQCLDPKLHLTMSDGKTNRPLCTVRCTPHECC
ncbi:hypothetical protein TNCV_4338601 [Trichonephila clavipes]|nr:hypothetical protein TNCV_4338601 [Trichonephila clavipes]